MYLYNLEFTWDNWLAHMKHLMNLIHYFFKILDNKNYDTYLSGLLQKYN